MSKLQRQILMATAGIVLSLGLCGGMMLTIGSTEYGPVPTSAFLIFLIVLSILNPIFLLTFALLQILKATPEWIIYLMWFLAAMLSLIWWWKVGGWLADAQDRALRRTLSKKGTGRD